MAPFRGGLTYGNVTATVALFVALASTSYGVGTFASEPAMREK
jgi:hypothetical protein